MTIKLKPNKIFELRPFINRNNNQISFTLPRRQMNIPQGKFPQSLQIQIKNIKF